MQKFRDYIYCDEKRINSYIGQITELNRIKVNDSYEKEVSFDGGIKMPIAKAETALTEKTRTNYSFNTSSLEQIVSWACEEKNAINYEGQTLENKNKDNLIMLSGKMSIPEMSENIEILNSLANNTDLFSIIPISDDDKKNLSFIKTSDSIPILLELDSDYIFSCCLKKDSLLINYNDFFDNIEEEINIIGRIDKIYDDDEEIEIFDLTKEIFKLNRAVRRKIPKEQLKDAIIVEHGPLVKITPIIIYK